MTEGSKVTLWQILDLSELLLYKFVFSTKLYDNMKEYIENLQLKLYYDIQSLIMDFSFFNNTLLYYNILELLF